MKLTPKIVVPLQRSAQCKGLDPYNSAPVLGQMFRKNLARRLERMDERSEYAANRALAQGVK